MAFIYSQYTDQIRWIELPPHIRCFWSEVETLNDSEVRLCVETRQVADGTAVQINVYSVEGDENTRIEMLDSIEGTIAEDCFEHQYHVSLTHERMDDQEEGAVLIFEAKIERYSLVAVSQRLVINRPIFSA